MQLKIAASLAGHTGTFSAHFKLRNTKTNCLAESYLTIPTQSISVVSKLV